MNKNTTFESERLNFREIIESDAEYLVKCRSNKELTKYFKNSIPVTIESHLKWFSNYLQDNTRFDFIIKIKENEKIIGTITASEIDYKNNNCNIGYAVYDIEEQGKGYAKEAVSALINYVKLMFNIKIIYAEIHEENIPSIKLVKSLNFEKDRFIKYMLIEK